MVSFTMKTKTTRLRKLFIDQWESIYERSEALKGLQAQEELKSHQKILRSGSQEWSILVTWETKTTVININEIQEVETGE